MSNDITVSIICKTFNHEKFIRQCLEGFVNQKTNFIFEAIVHDDASVDRTAAIIMEYEQKYPNIIKPIYEEENQYSKKRSINHIIYPKLTGKYIAFCEGDDYWTDINKLQLQVDALEKHKDCVACFHKVTYVDIEGKPTGRTVPTGELRGGILSQDAFMQHNFFPEKIRSFPWHLSGMLVRKEVWQEFIIDPPAFRQYFDVGDQPLFFHIGTKGPVFYIEDSMSNYRRSGNDKSWLGKTESNKELLVKHIETQMHALREVDKATGYQYHEYALKGIDNHYFQKYRALGDVKSMRSENMRELFNSLPRISQFYFICYPITSKMKYIKDSLLRRQSQD